MVEQSDVLQWRDADASVGKGVPAVSDGSALPAPKRSEPPIRTVIINAKSSIARPDWSVPAVSARSEMDPDGYWAARKERMDAMVSATGLRAVIRTPNIARPDWSAPAASEVTFSAEDRAAAMDPATGLPAEFVRDLSRSADGLHKGLDHLRTAITMRWPDNHADIAAWFDELSPSLQAKALSVFLHNSAAEFDALVAKVKHKATLAETAELNAWLNKVDQ